jgi:homoserine dehydrogenase
MSALDVIESVEAEVVVEVTPVNIKNGEPAMSHITKAFKTGKHVVTTNKGPLALAMPALIELAEYNNVGFRFSGTVGGGTPMLEFAKRCLAGDKILAIRGILNGTTNYVDRTGIRDVSLQALSEASKRSNTIKLIGSIGDDKPTVKPMEIAKSNPLCVSGVLNAVTFSTEFAGEQTLVGKGAGGPETASAVLRDLLAIRHSLADKMLGEG